MHKVYILNIHVDNRSSMNLKYADRIIDVFKDEMSAKKAMDEFDLPKYWKADNMELRASIFEQLSKHTPAKYFIEHLNCDDIKKPPVSMDKHGRRLVGMRTWHLINDSGYINLYIQEYELK